MQGRYRGSRRHWRQRTALAVAVAACFAGNFALANPTGPAVAQGQATFATQGNTLTVTNTPGTVINWQGFSIAGNEIARFIQQSQSSSVLNRVVGINPSAILGSLQSNGRVFLVNPNGITIGPGANIDVAGFMASTLNLSDADFLAGRMRFTQTPGAGSVVNHGTISTSSGGMVYLVGHDVQNSGIIRSPQGEILLAAGKSVELVDAQTPEVRVQLTAPDNQVLNLGQLIADGGRIGMYGTLIRHSGVASANTAVMGENGKIVFKAVKDVTLDAGSTVTASGLQGGSVVIQAETGTALVSGAVVATGSTGRGGSVQVLGQQVGLVGNANVDASGQAGGGSVLIGGDYKGGNAAVQNAGATFIGANALVRADAGATGDGGRVIVWSDSVTRAYGLISARGGSLSGNGGFVETSSAGYLEATRAPDIAAPAGAGGTWLLDPYNIVIGTATTPGTFVDTDVGTNANFVVTVPGVPSSLSTATIEAVLNAGANVIVDTTGVGLDAGNITVAHNVLKSAGVDSTLTLNAHNNISVDPGVSISATTSKLNLVFNADQDTNGAGGVTIGAGALLNSNGGNISLNGPSGITLSGNVTSGGGNIAFNHAVTIAGSVDPVVSAGAGNIGFASTIDGGGRSLTTNNTGTLTLGGAISNMVDLTIQGGPSSVALPQTTLSGDLSLTSAGSITQTGVLAVAGTSGITSTGGNVMLNNVGNNFGGLVTASGADISLRDTGALDAAITATGAGVLQAGDNLAVSGSTGTTLQTTTTGTGTTSFGVTTVGSNLTTLSAAGVGQTGKLTVTGTSGITATSGDIALAGFNNSFGGAVTANTSGLMALLTDVTPLTLGNVSITGTGSLTLLLGADVTQALGTAITKTGNGAVNVQANAAGANVTLANAGNDFGGGAVSVTNGLGTLNNVSVRDTSGSASIAALAPNIDGNLTLQFDNAAMTVPGVTVGGNLSLTATDIQQGGLFAVTGTSAFNSGTGDVALAGFNNSFGGTVTASAAGAGAVALRTDATPLVLGNVATGGAGLGLYLSGNVSQAGGTAITASGPLYVEASAAGVNVALASATNDFNGGSITLATAGPGTYTNVSLRDTDALASINALPANIGGNLTLHFDNAGMMMPGVTVSGNLSLTAGAEVQQSGVFTVTGTSTFSAGGGGVLLAGQNNSFGGTVTASATGASGAVALLTDATPLALGNVSIAGTGNLTLLLGADVTQALGTAITKTGNGAVNVQANAAGTNVTLANAGNDFGGGAVSVTNGLGTLNNVSVRDTAGSASIAALAPNIGGDLTLQFDNVGMTLAGVAVGGNLQATAGGTITVSGAVSSTGTTTLTTTAGDIALGADVGSTVAATTLIAAGNITRTSGTVHGGSLLLDAGTAIGTGTGAASINTDAGTLAARTGAGATGGIFVTAANDLVIGTVGAVAGVSAGNGGTVDIRTTAGDITLNNNVSVTGAANVTLIAGGGAGKDLIAGAGRVSTGSGLVTLQGAAVGTTAAPILTDIGTGTLTATSGAGDIAVSNNSVGGLNTTQLTGFTTGSGAQAISVSQTIGNLSLGGNVNVGTDVLSLYAGVGNINGNAATTLTASALTLDAGGLIGGANAVNTNTTGTLTLNGGGAAAAGNITVSEANALPASRVNLGGTGTGSGRTVSLTSVAGPITVDAAIGNAADHLTLVAAAGNIAGGGGTVTATNLTLNAMGSIGAGTAVNSNTSGNLSLTTAGNAAAGDVALVETNTLNTSRLTALSTTGSGTQSVNLTASSITLGTAIGNTADNLTLIASGGTISGAGLVSASDLRLDAFNAIGSAGTPVSINTAGNLAARLTNGAANGAIVIAEVAAGTGLTVGIANGLSGVTSINNRAITLSADSGNIVLNQLVNSGSGQLKLDTVNSGNVSVAANASGGLVDISAAGTISDSAQISGTTLTTISAGGTVLDFGHAVSAFNATNTSGGNMQLTNTTPVLTVTGISQNGGGDVIINNTGALTVDGVINNAGSGGAITLTGSTGINLNQNLTANNGSITLNNATMLGADTVLTGAGITFGSTLNSSGAARTLQVDDSGTTTFSGAVGNTLALASLIANGAVAIDGGSVVTTGVQTYSDAVTLGANTTLTGVGITFNGALNSAVAARTLQVNDSGATVFGGLVGNTLALASLATDAGGTTAINTTSLNTTGAQTYNDAVTLGANAVLASSGSGDISFIGTVNGPSGLTVNTAGNTIFSAAVGGTTPLASLTTDAAGSTQVNGGAVTTVGAQTYNDGITIAGPTTFNATATTATLDFNATLAAASHALTLTADEINFAGGAGSVTGSGTMLLQPNNTAAAINVGSAAGATVGALDLAAADLAALADGFSAITIGQAAGAHAMTIGNAVFQDSLLVRTPAGGSVNVNGALSLTENVAFNIGGAVQGSGSITASRVTIVAGGIGSLATPLQLDTPDLDVQNSAGNAVMANVGPVNLLNNFRNTAAGGELRLIANNGAINTGAVAVQSAGGRIALIANDTTGGATGNVIVGTGGITSAGGDIALHAADNITINGAIAAGAGNVRMLAGTGPGINAAHASFTGGNPPAPTELATDEFGFITFNAPVSAANMVLVSSTSTTPTVINAITQTANGAISTTGALTAVTLRGGGAPGNGGGTVDLNDATGNNSTGLINLFACSFDGCPNPLPTVPFVNQGAPVPPFTTAVYSDGQLFYSDVGGTNVTGIGTSGDFTLYTPGSVTITGPSLSAKNLTIEALVDINVDLLAPFTNNDINGGQPGGSLNFIAGQNVNYTSMVAGGTIGTAATPFNHDLKFQAAGNVTLANSVYIGTGNFVVQANQPVSLDGNTINIPATGTGSVLMQGNHVVSSMGDLTVSGVNLTVQGGDVGSPNQSIGGQQLLSAGTIALNLTGDVNVAGGTATANSDSGALIRGAVVNVGSPGTPVANLNLTGGTSVVNGTTNHVADARITGTSALNVRVAGNVGITGGSATITGTAGASQTAGASAILEGGSFTFEVAGDVTLTGGVADAATGGNTASANAQIVAHSAFNPVIQGDLNLIGGSATAQPIAGQIANAVAGARFESDGNLQLNVSGNIDLQGGTAVAINNSGGAFAEADAGAFVNSGAKIGINVGQNFDITGGSATATGSSLRAIASAGINTGDIATGESLLISTAGNMRLTGGTGAGAAADAAALIYSAAEAKLNIGGAGGLRLEGGTGPFFPPFGSGVFTPNSGLFQMIGGNSLVRIGGGAYPITVTGLITVVSNPALGAALFISEAPPLSLDSLLAAFIKTTDCVSFSGGSCTLSGAVASGSGKSSKDPAGGVCK